MSTRPGIDFPTPLALVALAVLPTDLPAQGAEAVTGEEARRGQEAPLYRDASEEERLPTGELEGLSMDAAIGDLDGDGDPDLLFANVRAFVRDADPANRLLLNDGTGRFAEAGPARLPVDEDASFDGDLIDLDRDGDLDVVTSNSDTDLSAGRIDPAPWRVYLNDGSGRFRLATDEVFPPDVTGVGFDVEAADLDGDGLLDLYLASRGTADRLLIGVGR